ncbi:hypothetical protein HD596_002496 [Nonomuraea jabiensis]|uniref:Uncharacterized protein n=1 Tax=Nonomuraea jabiensis TaxID=882448 RepID=A0A7W9G222_9ACTN|nr:hypothetical protein [Nonomuraea jabiensis]
MGRPGAPDGALLTYARGCWGSWWRFGRWGVGDFLGLR